MAPLGVMSSKGTTGGPGSHNLELILGILGLMMKSKKILGDFNSSFKTYTSCYGVYGTMAFIISLNWDF